VSTGADKPYAPRKKVLEMIPAQNSLLRQTQSSSNGACSEGSGAMLTTNLPRNSRMHDSSTKPLAGQRILLAEDEGLIALELERILEDFGCEVVGPLASVDAVLENAQHGGFDGALLDVNLRGRQIFEILPALQKLGLRLIITSGYDDVTLFPPSFRAMPRIPKPFDERELRRICEKVFTKPS
jgi:CheY-like chemotaxis protein